MSASAPQARHRLLPPAFAAADPLGETGQDAAKPDRTEIA